MVPTYGFLTKGKHSVIDGIGINGETIIEMLSTATQDEINQIRRTYHICEFANNLYYI